MKVTKIEKQNSAFVRESLLIAIRDSRFTAEIEFIGNTDNLNIRKVRLRNSKQYCGNHPKACELPNQKHRKSNYLEGADWVEFNDLVNDTLDRLGVSAHVASSVCIIRKGAKRRFKYDGNTQFGNGTWQWDKDAPDSHYSDCRHTSPRESDFPEGTPGQYKERYFVVG